MRRSKSESEVNKKIVATFSAKHNYSGDKTRKQLPRNRHLVRRLREPHIITDTKPILAGKAIPSINTRCAGAYDREHMGQHAKYWFFCNNVPNTPKPVKLPQDPDPVNRIVKPNPKERFMIAIPTTIKLVPSPSPRLCVKDPPGDQEGAADEYLMTIESVIDRKRLQWLTEVMKEEVEFMVILDKSYSMNGRPWEQVLSGMEKIIEMTKGLSRIFVTVMVYDQRADFVNVDVEQIKAMPLGSLTNFVAVFEMVTEVLLCRTAKGQDPNIQDDPIKLGIKRMRPRKLFVFFLTDGNDTWNTENETQYRVPESMEELRKAMSEYGQEVVVHTLGYGVGHNDKFLEYLSTLGTDDGTYNYIGPEDGNAALEALLTSLVWATTFLVGKFVFLELKMLVKENWFLGDSFGPGCQEVTIKAFLSGSKRTTIETSKFVRLPGGTKNFESKISATLIKELKDNSQFVSCKIVRVDVNDGEETETSLRKVRAGLNLIAAGISRAAAENTMDDTHWNLHKNWLKHLRIEVARAKDIVESRNDVTLDSLYDSVQTGLRICEKAFDKNQQNYVKTARGTAATYFLNTKQFHNAMQFKSKQSVDGRRTERQAKQVFID